MTIAQELAAFPDAIAQPFREDPEVVLPAKAAEYAAAKPFRHAVFDGLFSDELLDGILAEAEEFQSRYVERDQKSYRKQIAENWTRQGPYTNYLINLVGSPRFLTCVEKLTGVYGLIFDPHLKAGGLHQTHRGGYLELHTDFNFNGRLGVFRRLNFLLYLNRDWKEEYNGHLELWDKDLTTSAKVLPVFNRLVICEVVASSLHGFPKPLACPEGMSRKSLALWYYTVDQPPNVQTGWDLCPPNFIERRDGIGQPLRRPLWRMLTPPVLAHFLTRERQMRSFSVPEFKRVATRFIPPIVAQAYHRVTGKRTY